MDNEIQVSTWEECHAAIQKIRQENPSQASKIRFRGQSKSEWGLATTLERRGRSAVSFVDYYRLAFKIKPEIETESGLRWEVPTFNKMASWAREYSMRHYEMLAYDYLAHLRHNGFPSPLLDWSRSLYVAAYFAFSDANIGDANIGDANIGNVAIYVYLEAPDGVKGGGEGFPTIRTLGQYVKTHKRHFRQQSAYTVCANFKQDAFDPTNQWRFVSHQLVFDSKPPTKQDVLWKIVVPATERAKVMSLLDEANLNAYSLFGSEESLMETLAYREIDLKPL